MDIRSCFRGDFSFSTNIDECVGIMINYLRNRWSILDVNGTFTYEQDLFHCDKRGANNTLLDTGSLLTAPLRRRGVNNARVFGQHEVTISAHRLDDPQASS
jgi:hypothetical protein